MWIAPRHIKNQTLEVKSRKKIERNRSGVSLQTPEHHQVLWKILPCSSQLLSQSFILPPPPNLPVIPTDVGPGPHHNRGEAPLYFHTPAHKHWVREREWSLGAAIRCLSPPQLHTDIAPICSIIAPRWFRQIYGSSDCQN